MRRRSGGSSPRPSSRAQAPIALFPPPLNSVRFAIRAQSLCGRAHVLNPVAAACYRGAVLLGRDRAARVARRVAKMMRCCKNDTGHVADRDIVGFTLRGMG